MMTMILQHRKPLNININNKGIDNKVVRCVVSVYLVDWNFANKEAGDVDILEASKEDGKPFHIFCFKEPDYLMNIMELCTTLDDLEGGNTKHN